MAGVKGRSGRKPKSTQTLKLHGGFRPDRHNTDAPEPEIGKPEAPKWLTGSAREEWNRILPLLLAEKCVSRWDRAALVLYCQEWKTYVEATQKLRMVRGLLAKGSKGQLMEHPLLRIRDKAFRKLLQVASEFGLTPAARSRLNVQAGDATDPLELWLKAQGDRRRQAGEAG